MEDRDEFAKAAMQAMVTANVEETLTKKSIAYLAYEQADAMIDERAKRNKRQLEG